MRRCVLLGLLLSILLTGGAAVADERSHDLDEAVAKELVAKAASSPPALLQMMAKLGTRLRLEDLLDSELDVSLTAATALLGRTARIDERDFKLSSGATPATFAAAISPTEVKRGQRVAKHPYASILHPEYVIDITVDVNGRTATGVVRFRAPGVYAGTAHYGARYDDAGWRVVELRFRHSEVRTTLENGRWRLQVPAAASTVNPLRGKQLSLPRVGTVGTVPSARARVIVSVTREGWIRVPDRKEPLSLLSLERYLADKTNDPRLTEPDGASRLGVLLDVDATIPWVITQWLMQTCAHPRVKIYRIWLGARAHAGGQDGAIAMVLPKDRGLAPTARFPTDFIKHKLKVFKREGPGPSDMRALYAALKKRHDAAGRGRPNTKFEIVAPPPKGGAVPHGYVVQMLDVCLAVGAHDIIFEGAASPLGSLADSARELARYIDAVRASPGVPMVKLSNSRSFVGSSGHGLPAVPARGTLKIRWGAGMSQAVEQLEEVVEESIEEEPEVRAPSPPKEDDDAPDGLLDEPFQGPADNGRIGLGGGAGGAFRGRGGSRDLGTGRDGRKKFDDAVDDALRWLAAHQSPNGSWEAAGFGQWCDGRPVSDASRHPDGLGKALYGPGVTGLALCAFLGAGYTHRGKHPYAKVVSRGLRYLKNIQDPEGCFGVRSTRQYIYNHATCALAMVEAYGMTGSPVFKGSAQRALDFIALARNPYFAWRYGIKPGDNDTSVSGWMMMALKSAQLVNKDAIKRGKPAPLTLDELAFDGLKAWLEKVTDPKTGRVGYVAPGTGPARPQEVVDRFPSDKSESMTAVGMLARTFMGEDPRRSKVIKRGADLCAKLPPTWNPSDGSIDMYYWYYGTLAMFQFGGSHWTAWKRAMEKAMLETQREDTDPCRFKGSWDPIGPWGMDGGRVYSTAILALCCEVFYRYERVFGPGR